MSPRAVILTVILASSGSFIAGQAVQAQVDKNTVFNPLGVEGGGGSGMDWSCLNWQVTTVATYNDGGHDADGGLIDGGATGLVERIYGPNVVVSSSATLTSKVADVMSETCARNAVVARSQVSAVEDAIRTQVVPALAAQCNIALTDGGY